MKIVKTSNRDPKTCRRRSGQSGHAVIEFALSMPWLWLLLVGTLDCGFYLYAFISAENAARVAALYTSSSNDAKADSSGACSYALSELGKAPNMSGVTSCASLPLIVSAQATTGPDGAPASTVTVTYRTLSLIPIPGLLGNQMTVSRAVQMRVK